MADFAPNYTPRYRLRYSALGKVHVMTIRGSRGDVGIAARGQEVFTDFLAAMQPYLSNTWTIVGADVAGTDSDVFLPTTALPTLPTLGAAAGDISYRPNFLSFVGRSTSGNRASLYLYGVLASPTAASAAPDDYRITAAEDSSIGDAVAALNGSGAGEGARAIDGNDAVWYPYANVGFNAYYQRKARQG
jgi:hypothetical protein